MFFRKKRSTVLVVTVADDDDALFLSFLSSFYGPWEKIYGVAKLWPSLLTTKERLLFATETHVIYESIVCLHSK